MNFGLTKQSFLKQTKNSYEIEKTYQRMKNLYF